ncbi:hypothetical protein F5Y19DRAFT_330398 [Xylariaceae sp. FL1651]|nr:hypothetical protein F5Y19DRAFT_330398 [Xylariaceae sp. FL1651]
MSPGQQKTSPRKNGDIRGFFRPAAPSGSQTWEQLASSPLLMPNISSSPRTPPKSVPRVFNRSEVIKGSDDSEDDSDNSLGSITDILGHRPSPAAHQRDANVLSTPQAKRIASGVHRSPLTLQPKRHKFDLKALINHSREIERTEESVKKADALIAQGDRSNDASEDSDAQNDPKRFEEAACKLLIGGGDEDGDEGKGEKLRRALKRAQVDKRSSHKHCLFFSQEEPLSKPVKHPFPRKTAVGRWKCLSQPDSRRQAFIMGLPYTFISKGETLPDELFLWLLDETCTEQDAELRRQYINLAGICEDNTSRLVNDKQLYAMLERIGGPKYAREHSKFKSTTEVRHEYLERDWTALVAFLQLLERIAPNLQTSAAISAVQLLLRMSLDPVVATIVREHHMGAMKMLVSRLAKPRAQWNTACEAICSYVYENVDEIELKIIPTLFIPSSTTHLVDLRRRMAAESLFQRPGLGGKPINEFLSFEKIRNRIYEDDFKPVHKADFEQLRALTTLLDIVIDNADFIRPCTQTIKNNTPKTATSASPSQITCTSSNTNSDTAQLTKSGESLHAETKADLEHKFNAEVDIIAARIKEIHDNTRDKPERKNVKLSLLSLEKRLKYAVRTQPPPKKEIFASEGTAAYLTDANVPKQRDFMRHWALKKKAEKERQETDVLEDAELATNGQHVGMNVRVAVG